MASTQVHMKAYRFLSNSIDYLHTDGDKISSADVTGRSPHVFACILAKEFGTVLAEAEYKSSTHDAVVSPMACILPSLAVQDKMDVFFGHARQLAMNGSVHTQMLVEKICLQLHGQYSLYTVWFICHYGLAQLQTLLGGDALELPVLTDQLLWLNQHLQACRFTCATSKAIMQDMLVWLLDVAAVPGTAGAEVATSLLDLLTDECWCHLSRDPCPGSVQRHCSAGTVSMLTQLSDKDVDCDVRKKLCVRCLKRFIATTPLQDGVCMFASHHDASLAKSPEKVSTFIRELLVPLTSEEILAFLLAQCDSIDAMAHWLGILSCVSVALAYKTGFSAQLQDVCGKNIASSLHQFNAGMFHRTMLLARHAGLAGADIFPIYSEWFRLHLSGAVNPLPSTQRGMQFFFQALSSIVPHESLDAIKVHTAGVQVEGKFRQLYFDFIQLCKTRRNDLLAKEAEESHVSGTLSSHQARLAEDIEDAIHVFATSGQVSKKVLKSSVFERPYYKGQFLPALLAPKSLEEMSTAREAFISKLVSIGKAQPNSLALYQSECQNLVKKEVTSIDKLSVEELLAKLSNTLCSADIASSYQQLSDVIQCLSVKLTPAKFDHIPALSLNTSKPNLCRPSIEVIDHFLWTLGRALDASDRFPPSQTVVQTSVRLFSLLARSRYFQFVIYIRLWDIVEYQVDGAALPLLRCFALCLHCMQQQGSAWLRVGAYLCASHRPRQVQFCQQRGGCFDQLPSMSVELLEVLLRKSSADNAQPSLSKNTLCVVQLLHQLQHVHASSMSSSHQQALLVEGN
eukprot:scpid30537/ scgid5621/ Fanconi anemia group A protein